MVTEWLMERYGWDAVWFTGSNGLRRGPFRFVGAESCYVGVWTGKDLDLLCVREWAGPTRSAPLSPPGWTITHAAIKSWLRLMKIRRSDVKNLKFRGGRANTKSHSSKVSEPSKN